MTIRFSVEEFAKLKELLLIYEWGQRTLLTKLAIVHEDFENFQEINPIDHIRGRIKAPESIAEKLHKFGLDITAGNAKKYIYDIAGVRIICPFAKDIYNLVELIRSMPDITLIEEKDYVRYPKKTGYRSYHLIVAIPIFYSGRTELVTIEIQIRTEAMNFWATLEHEARYKYQGTIPQHLSDELVFCADEIAELDNRMFMIHENIMGGTHDLHNGAKEGKDKITWIKKPTRRELRRNYRHFQKT